ncbi:MAG: hypothetical protein PF517_15935 [Salinivirgaceae bacterium]|jgi:hypothetical protein|nr:hypothetical protein [Salinivirgaceae bacterium]
MSCKAKIKLQGHLDKKWENWFEGMELSHENDTTILCGYIKDHAYMYGLINKIRDLNLKLISINPAE